MGRECIECKDHLGKEYSSISAMCGAYGIHRNTFIFRRKKGMTLEQALAGRSRTIKDHLGNTYRDKTAMCKAYGLSTSAFNKRLKAGWSLEESLTLPWGWSKVRACKDHLGKTYPTTQAMCGAYGIHCNTFMLRIKKGMTLEQALTTAKHEMIKL